MEFNQGQYQKQLQGQGQMPGQRQGQMPGQGQGQGQAEESQAQVRLTPAPEVSRDLVLELQLPVTPPQDAQGTATALPTGNPAAPQHAQHSQHSTVGGGSSPDSKGLTSLLDQRLGQSPEPGSGPSRLLGQRSVARLSGLLDQEIVSLSGGRLAHTVLGDPHPHVQT